MKTYNTTNGTVTTYSTTEFNALQKATVALSLKVQKVVTPNVAEELANAWKALKGKGVVA